MYLHYDFSQKNPNHRALCLNDTTIQQNSYPVDKLYHPDEETRHPDEGTRHPDARTNHPEPKEVFHLQKRAFQLMANVFIQLNHLTDFWNWLIRISKDVGIFRWF